MGHFNKSFPHVYVGIKPSQTASATAKEIDNGFLDEDGVNSIELQNTASPYSLGIGTFGLFDKSYNSLSSASVQSLAAGTPLRLISAAIKPNDSQGIHEGYAISDKSHVIYPNNILRFSVVEPCLTNQAVVHIGNTAYTSSGPVLTASVSNGGSNYTVGDTVNLNSATGGDGLGILVTTVDGSGAITGFDILDSGDWFTSGDLAIAFNSSGGGLGAELTIDSVDSRGGCDKEFTCGNTYTLRLNISGDPALRAANHELYRDFDAYGGCCALDASGDPVVAPIDSTLIMIQWAQGIVSNPITKPFISPIVYDELGNPLFENAEAAIAAGYTANDVWSEYVSTGHTVGATAGLRLLGAYTDTTFSNCSFKPTDYVGKYAVKIIPSMVYRGEEGGVCAFEGLCVTNECYPMTGVGYGEDAVRDLALSESYRQNYYEYNPRLREVTQGDSIFVVDRGQMYTQYFLQYREVRVNNNTSLDSNDNYTAQIITQGRSSAFEAAMGAWMTAVHNQNALEVIPCVRCVPSAV